MDNTKIIKWIGLAKVRVTSDNTVLGSAKGAYVNAVGFGKSKSEFRSALKTELLTMHLRLIRLTDAEPLGERRNKFKVSKDILRASKSLSRYSVKVAFSTFHAFPD